MAEEYKRKWHEHHDPKADKKQYIGTKILDEIEKGAVEWYQDERTLEGWEYLNPTSVVTAGAIRAVEGVGTVLAHTPGVAQGLQAIGKVEDVAAGTAGSITGSLNLDPRFGGWATRLASAWYGGKAITAASKTRTAQNLSKAAVKFGKIQADEIGMKAHTLLKKKHGKDYTRVDTTNAAARRATEIRLQTMDDLRMQLENSIDGIDITPNPNRFKATEFTGRAGGMIDKFLGQQGKIKDVQNIIDAMDDWRIAHAANEHPMTGFTKHFGGKPTLIIDGQEHVIGWSRKANKGKGRYTIRNLEAQKAVQRSRIEKNLTSNVSEAEKGKIQELIRRDMNFKSKNLSPDQWDLLIQNPGDAYIEHFISIKSPFWQSTRGKNAGYKAGDLRNRKILGDQNFKTLKDNVEKHIHAKHKDLYVDYDPISQNIVLKRLDTGKAIGNTQIPGYGKATDWKQYVDDSIADSGMMPIEDVYGIEKRSAPANIQRDIDSTLFKGLDDVSKDAIIDRVNGASWNQIQKDYGKSLKQLSLIKKTYSNLTKSQVSRLMKAYNLDGKGRTRN